MQAPPPLVQVYSYNNHIRDKINNHLTHKAKLKTLSCPLCGTMYPRRDRLSKNLESEHGVQDDSEKPTSRFFCPFKCDLPPFRTMRLLLGHCQAKHENLLGKIDIFLINRCSKLSRSFPISPHQTLHTYITLLQNIHTTTLSETAPDTTKVWPLSLNSGIA